MAGVGIHFDNAVAPPGMRLYAIGDVHGRFDLLRRMHDAIADDLARRSPDDFRVIHLGDYVDRGPQSREVVDLLCRAQARDARYLALAGNHDIGLLEFLSRPTSSGLFARFGGRETAQSYGVAADLTTEQGARIGADDLLMAMPDAHFHFLQRLPRHAAFGDFYFCHAGVRPGTALADQAPDDLIWIRDAFTSWPHLHEKVIVHGHTPVARPDVRSNRVNLDTGAFATGILSALVVDGRNKCLVEVSESAIDQRDAWTTP